MWIDIHVQYMYGCNDHFVLQFVCAGKMKGLAFIKDPDGYWIEILNPNMKL